MPFDGVWMEATHDCVFATMLGGLRGSIGILEKLYLMMLPVDNVKDSHVSTRIEFMW